MTKLPSNPLISEVLKAVHGRKTVDGKVKLLQEHKGDHIKALLIWNFDKGIESAIPEGDVPYKKNESPAGTAGHTRLAHEWRTLYNFVRGGNDKLSQMKRETLFVQLLESLHADEAETSGSGRRCKERAADELTELEQQRRITGVLLSRIEDLDRDQRQSRPGRWANAVAGARAAACCSQVLPG